VTTRLYDVYGLAVASEVALPFGLAAAGRAPDLEVIWRLRSDASPLPPSAPPREFRHGAEGWRLCYAAPTGAWGALEYLRAQRRLVLTGSSPRDNFLQPLMGPAAAVLLREAGCCVLHGAAAAVDGGALALLGPSGAGKSTLAAALIAGGGTLISDDLVVLWPDEVAVAAGPDVLSLDAEAACRFAGLGPTVRTRPSDGKDWVRPRAPHGAGERARLAAVVILAPFDDNCRASAQATLEPRAATIALMLNLYGASWIGAPGPADLQACARIAAEIPVRRLQRPRDLAALEATARSLRAATL
jgi:hypothetical protein